MQCTLDQVNDYFSCHLHRRNWQQLPADIQAAAIKMAEEDILLALNCDTLDITELLVFCSVCEQALFLGTAEYERQKNEQDQSKPQLKSESIEGVGKREYYAVAESKSSGTQTDFPASGRLAPRSELFLARLAEYREKRFGRG